jgi:hypothetical protein
MQEPALFPTNLFVKMTKANPEIEIDPEISNDGDVIFRVPLDATGFGQTGWNKTPLLRTYFAMNYFGELLVRKNLDAFAQLLETIQPHAYHRLVNCYKHQSFGYKAREDCIEFRFHLSLVQRILIEDMNELLGARKE